MDDRPVRITVDGQAHEFTGRAALMLRMFVAGRGEIDDLPASGRGDVSFHFDRDAVSLNVNRFVLRRRLAYARHGVVTSVTEDAQRV